MQKKLARSLSNRLGEGRRRPAVKKFVESVDIDNPVIRAMFAPDSPMIQDGFMFSPY